MNDINFFDLIPEHKREKARQAIVDYLYPDCYTISGDDNKSSAEGNTMIKKLTRHGNSIALLLDKSLLSVLDISLDTELKITTDGKSINITPVSMTEVKILNERTQKSFDEVMEKYQETFRFLARN